jgi:DNA-binding XRE family transcriptional regulator
MNWAAHKGLNNFYVRKLRDIIRYKVLEGFSMREIGTKRDWLVNLRKEKGMPLREIAPYMGLSYSHLSDIENGRRNPSIELSIKMAKFYGVDVALFLQDRVKFNEKNIG